MKTYSAGSHTHDLYGAVKAKGDGSDDTGAFHAAIAKGGDVFVPPGIYSVNINETLISGVRLHGDQATLQPFDLTKPAIEMTGSVAKLEIDHLAIDGRHRDGAGAVGPVYLQDATWVSIHDCAFSDAAFRAINFSNNLPSTAAKSRVWIERNTFVGNERDAIFLGNVHSFWVHENYIESAPDTAIDGGQGAENGNISDNTIIGCQTGVFMSDFLARMVISRNIITDVTGNGIHVSSGANAARTYVISDNVIEGNRTGATGIHSGGITGQTIGALSGLISGNIIRDSGYAGIAVDAGSDGTFVTGNLIDNPAGASLRLGSANLKVAGNSLGGGAVVLTGAAAGLVVS